MINILNSIKALEKINQQQLTGVEAYKIGKTLKLINNQISLYDQSRKKLCEECCVKDENGHIKIDEHGNAQVIQDKITLFNQEMSKLNNLQIELNIPELLLDDLTNLKLTPQEANSLEWWIK